MRWCRACGHPLGDASVQQARFCPHCGQPTGAIDDWRTDTAERPRVAAPAPRTPPHAGDAPPPARFPLYADEYVAPHADPHADQSADEPPTEAPPEPPTQDWFSRAASARPDPDVTQVQYWEEERRSPFAWVVVSLAVVVLVLLVWWYLARAH